MTATEDKLVDVKALETFDTYLASKYASYTHPCTLVTYGDKIGLLDSSSHEINFIELPQAQISLDGNTLNLTNIYPEGGGSIGSSYVQLDFLTGSIENNQYRIAIGNESRLMLDTGSSLNAGKLVGTVPLECLPSGTTGGSGTSVSASNNANGGLDLTIGNNTYNVLNSTSSLDATKLTGTVPVANLPQEALSSGGSAPLSAAGSANQPVYINESGVPTACGFKIAKVTALPAEPDPDTLYIVTEA